MRDDLETRDRVYLEKLRLSVQIILRMGEDPESLPNVLESELFLLRDRIDRAILLAPEPAVADKDRAVSE